MPEITVFDEIVAEEERFPLEMTVERAACAAFVRECGVSPDDVPRVSVTLTPTAKVTSRVIPELGAILPQMVFVDAKPLDENATVYAGTVYTAILGGMSKPESEKLLNRVLGKHLSECADAITLGIDYLKAEQRTAEREIERDVLQRRLIGSTILDVASVFGSELLFSSWVYGALAGAALTTGVMLGNRTNVNMRKHAAQLEEDWPYQRRAKERVARMVEPPDALPLITYRMV